MRISARISSLISLVTSVIFSFGLAIGLFLLYPAQVSAQTPMPSVSPAVSNSVADFTTIDADPNVPRNQHSLAQIVVLDVFSAVMCQLIGFDPVTKTQSCLVVNPVTNQIGLAPSNASQFGMNHSDRPQLGGAMGLMTNMVGMVYTPTVSSAEYGHYLASNFGIVKTAAAQTPPTATFTEDCAKEAKLGYGACGLKPIFKLWAISRDLAYAVLVLAFVFLGIGIMTRFKVDPRTVMTLQNQIPRVIIAILLITFSYGIAGLMIDLMWTVTYTGINMISQGSKVAADCSAANPAQQTGTLTGAANQNLINQPISFTNAIYDPDCATWGPGVSNDLGSGIINVANRVSDSLGSLIENILANLFGWDTTYACGTTGFNPIDCLQAALLWVTSWIVALIVIVTIFIALFRLWFQLIKIYVTTLIFIILGPIWIVMGLIPGRPMGFEKWLRLIFANLAAFPLVAFVLVFGRVMIDALPAGSVSPQSIFIPPLVGNPNVAAFTTFIGFGAIMVAPNIPEMIRERMKVPQSKLGSNIAGGVAVGAGIATAPATKLWKQTTRKDSQGRPVGALAAFRERATASIPIIGKRIQARKIEERENTGTSTLRQRRARRREIREGL